MIGWVFLVSGGVGLVTTFWMRNVPGFWWALVSAVSQHRRRHRSDPLADQRHGIADLVLIAFFVVEGVATIMYAIEHKAQLSSRWGWMLMSGIVDLILAGIIFAGLPESATWALGLLVGINMLFGGTAMIGMALAARNPA